MQDKTLETSSRESGEFAGVRTLLYLLLGLALGILILLVLIFRGQTSPTSFNLQQTTTQTTIDHLANAPNQVAIAEFKEAMVLSPQNKTPFRQLVELSLADEDYEAIQETLDLALEYNPGQLWPFQEIVKIYARKLPKADAYARGIALWEQGAILRPDSSSPYLYMAELHQNAKETDAALEAYERAIQADPEHAHTHFVRAGFLDRQGLTEQALQAYQWASALEPQSAYYQFIVGREFLEAGQTEAGTAQLESALQLDNNLRMHSDVQKLYTQYLLPEESIASYERIVTADPTDSVAVDTLLEQFILSGQCEAALTLAEPDVASDIPPTFNSYLKLAETAKTCQTPDIAVDSYQAAIETAPQNPIGYLELGLLRLSDGNIEEAHELFIQSAQLDTTAATYNKVKAAYLDELEISKALDRIRDMLTQAEPPLLHPYEDLITQYKKIGQSDQDLPLLKIAASAMPTDHALQFKVAQNLSNMGQLSESIVYYDMALEREPTKPDYQLYLGQALFLNGDIEAGSALLTTVLQNDPSHKRYEFIRDLYYNNLAWPEPQPYLEELALIRWPQTDLSYTKLAQWYTTYGYPEAAIETYQKLIETLPNDPKHDMALGNLYFQLGQINEAEASFTQALVKDKSNESYQAIQKGYFNYWGGSEALERLTTLLEEARPSVKEVYIDHARRSSQLGLGNQQLPIWRLAAEVLPQDTDLQIRLAQTLLAQDETEQAIEIYQQAIEQNPDQTRYRLALGNLLLQSDQADEGATILKNALLRDPKKSTYISVRNTYQKYVSLQNIEDEETDTETETDSETDSGSGETADWAYQEELARIIWPNPIQAYKELAKWYLDNGQLSQAILAYERMIEAAPNDPTSYLALGQLQFDLGEIDTATELFTQAVARSQDKGAYRTIQRFYLERLSVEEGLEKLQQNLAEAQPSIKQPYIDLINQYKRNGIEGRNIPVLQSALQGFGLDILPQDADLYYLLAEALYEQEEIEAAIGAYRRAATMQPQNQEWQLNYGRALLAGAHVEDGLRILKAALARKSNANTYNFVRNSLHELVEWPESQTYQEEVAQIYWVQAKRKTPAAAYKQLAAWYEAQGEVGAAIATYENATTLLADDPASYLALGLLQFDAGEIAASQAHFEQAVALDTTPKTYRAIQELYTSKLSPRRAASSLLYLLNQARPQLLQPYADLKAFYGALGDPSQDTAILQLAAEAMPDNDKALAGLGQTFYDTDQIEESISLYRRAVALRPDHTAYGFALGRSMLTSEEFDEATTIIEQALRQDPSQRNYDAARSLYQEHLAEESLQEAQERLALIRWPLPSEAYGNLAKWYQSQDAMEDAATAYEKALEADDTIAQLYVDLGRLQFEQGEAEAAQANFTQAIALDQSPRSARSIWQLYANTLELNQALASQLNLIAEARPMHVQPYNDLIEQYKSVGLTSPEPTILQLAADVMPEDSQIHYRLAEILYSSELYDEALTSYDKAVEIEPTNPQYRLGRGRALLATGEVDDGVDILQAVLRQKPTKRTYEWVRDTYEETLAWPESEPYQLRASLVFWPNFRQGYGDLAKWYGAAGQSDAAIATYQQILEIEAENRVAHERLTALYLEQDSCEDASYHALQFAQIADDANSYQALAETYTQCGPEEAVAVSYQRSMAKMVEAEVKRKKPRNVVDMAVKRYSSELVPEEVVTLLNTALLDSDLDVSSPYSQLGWYWETVAQPDNALPLYEKAVEIEPTSGNNHYTLGRLYHELGDTEQALPEYQRALALSGSKNQSTYLRYGKALIETGRYDQGAEMLERGFALERSEWALGYVLTQYMENLPPADAEPYIVDALQLRRLGQSESYIETFMQPVRYYLEQGRPETAIALLEMASEMNSKLTWPYVRLFYVYRGLERPAEAVEVIRQATLADPKDAWLHLTLGNALRRRGDIEGAVSELRQSVELAPREAWYQIYFGHALLQNEQPEEGVVAFQHALDLVETEDAYIYIDNLYSEYLTPQEAITFYEHVLVQRPEDMLAKQYLESWRQNLDSSESSEPVVDQESSR